MDTFLLLSYVTQVILLLNVILYAKSFVRNNKAFRIFTIYIGYVFIIQLAATIIGKGFHQPNLFLTHFYLIGQFVLLSLFYYELSRYSIIKKLIWPALLLIAYQFIDDPSLFFRYNQIGFAVTQFIIVIYAIIYLYKSLGEKRPFLIVNTGILFYLISSILIFASGNLVLNLDISEDTRFLLINVNRVLILFFQLLIFAEWYRNYRRSVASN